MRFRVSANGGRRILEVGMQIAEGTNFRRWEVGGWEVEKMEGSY